MGILKNIALCILILFLWENFLYFRNLIYLYNEIGPYLLSTSSNDPHLLHNRPLPTSHLCIYLLIMITQ